MGQAEPAFSAAGSAQVGSTHLETPPFYLWPFPDGGINSSFTQFCSSFWRFCDAHLAVDGTLVAQTTLGLCISEVVASAIRVMHATVKIAY
jgi:hypothetical protein